VASDSALDFIPRDVFWNDLAPDEGALSLAWAEIVESLVAGRLGMGGSAGFDFANFVEAGAEARFKTLVGGFVP